MSEASSRKHVSLYRGELKGNELPDEIDLTHMATTMDDLWEQSVRHVDQGQVREQAATLVLDPEGSLKMTNAIEGNSTSVIPDRHVGPDERIVGTLHTHPDPDGRSDMAFSGADIAYVINQGDTMILVRSYQEIFALVRTEKTVASVDRLDLEREFNALLDEHSMREDLSLEEAVLFTDLDLCRRYGLAFYQGGSDGELRVVYKP